MDAPSMCQSSNQKPSSRPGRPAAVLNKSYCSSTAKVLQAWNISADDEQDCHPACCYHEPDAEGEERPRSGGLFPNLFLIKNTITFCPLVRIITISESCHQACNISSAWWILFCTFFFISYRMLKRVNDLVLTVALTVQPEGFYTLAALKALLWE